MKAIETYQDLTGYNAAGKPTAQSRVALITEGNIAAFDGVNTETAQPELGDAIYTDGDGNRRAIKAEGYRPSLLPADWTYKGPFLCMTKEGKWKYMMGNLTSWPTRKYADVVQFKVTVPSATGTLSLGAQFVTAGTTTTITVQYTEGMDLAAATETYEENDTTLCGRINTALTALSGITGTWWAYLNGDGDVILQRDTWADSSQYECSGALTHVTWRDMPASSACMKVNGKTTSYRGILNFAGAAAYWSTNGRTPDSDVAVHSESGDTDPVTLAAFQSNAKCAAVRAYYGSYEAYLRGEFGILATMPYGTFALPGGDVLTAKYGPMTAPTKAGDTKAMFPALNWAYLQCGSLWDSRDAVLIYENHRLAKINATQTKAGKATVSNSSSRWLAERYSVCYARYFSGTPRMLNYNGVYNTYQVGAVSLL